MESVEKLLVVWKQPRTRLRYWIGTLSHEGGLYRFHYQLEGTRTYPQAKEVGFALLPFKDDSLTYESCELFNVFAARIPDREQQSAPLEYFSRTGGRLATDTLEFLTPVQAIGSREFTVTFPVAGWRYHQGEQALEAGLLAVGSELSLCLQPNNEWDPCAIQVRAQDYTLGYVPAVYAHYLDLSVSEGTCQARVLSIGSEPDPQLRLMVSCTFTAASPDGAELLPHDLQSPSRCLVA